MCGGRHRSGRKPRQVECAKSLGYDHVVLSDRFEATL